MYRSIHTNAVLTLSTHRAIEMMESLASKEGAEDYKTFWEAFGRNLKVGSSLEAALRALKCCAKEWPVHTRMEVTKCLVLVVILPAVLTSWVKRHTARPSVSLLADGTSNARLF